ncbi:hypothetical protein [uncultured Alcanivorax sp.]|uniref:hypothetical protein n=1 Tax=uncultured Alcanivorax sp. TaxID=191215 RepID=UPI0032B17BD6
MKALIFAPLALLAGCQHLNYQEPTTGETAQVTFTSKDTAAQPVVCVPGKGFQSTDYALSQSPISGGALDELLETMKKSPEVTTTVDAAPATRIGVIYNRRQADNSRDRCRVALQFSPQAGGDYQAHFVYDKGQCGLSLKDAAGNSVDAVQTDWQCP